jgi:hypothetical protein
MFRKSLIPLLAAAFFVAPAMLPSSFVSAIAPGLSGAAQGRTFTLHVANSNKYRTKKTHNGQHQLPTNGNPPNHPNGRSNAQMPAQMTPAK